MIDRLSPTWIATVRHCEAQIEMHRTELEDSGLSAEETATKRGRIQALRAILALAKDKPPKPPAYKPGAVGY